jgi:tRNA threonylcarbamoyl adenosine modification protein YeaZ
LILFIDTSIRQTFVGISDENISNFISEEGECHSNLLRSLVEKIVTEAGYSNFSKISKLVVGIGPGSFTGLRISLAFAKAFSLSLKVPLVTLPSHFAATYTIEKYFNNTNNLKIAVLTEGGKDLKCCSKYKYLDRNILSLEPPINDTLESINQWIIEEWIVNDVKLDQATIKTNLVGIILDLSGKTINLFTFEDPEISQKKICWNGNICQGLLEAIRRIATVLHTTTNQISEISPLYGRPLAAKKKMLFK